MCAMFSARCVECGVHYWYRGGCDGHCDACLIRYDTLCVFGQLAMVASKSALPWPKYDAIVVWLAGDLDSAIILRDRRRGALHILLSQPRGPFAPLTLRSQWDRSEHHVLVQHRRDLLERIIIFLV